MNMSSKVTTADSDDSEIVVSTSQGDVTLKKEDAAPIYYKPKGEGKTGFALVPSKDGEQIANYPLFEASMDKAKVSWENYERLTKDERTIYMAHLNALEDRKLTYEMSKHRTRPPVMGIHRRTRCNVVDNSALGKEAHMSGKRAYCIDVYKQGRRKKHLPHATLGDKILVAIRGQMRKAYVVGANTHVHLRKHGIPVTDTNNIVLLDEEGNPLGNRITAPIPAKLLEKKDRPQFAKVIALANKFI
ncbi:ribosomal protein L14p/L23e [Ancylostoma caninum]|uniref:Large ribosomal subunit protein uL14m n=1 Tax=Ancylostoma caninum TaxID=29170 RepID=A0A368GHF1_ANCCA|nr:ribosomal protein L14p/L23e [Ancylostoma caninum]